MTSPRDMTLINPGEVDASCVLPVSNSLHTCLCQPTKADQTYAEVAHEAIFRRAD